MKVKIILQIFIIMFLFYRFIIRRFVKINSMHLMFEEHSLENIMFISISILIFLFLIVSIIQSKKIISISTVNKSHFIDIIKNKIFMLFNESFFEPLKNFDKYIKKIMNVKFNIKRSAIINKFLNYLSDYSIKMQQENKHNKYLISFILIKILAKMIVVTVFLCDIFYHNHFYYFYWCLPLLIIPLLLQYFTYICFEDYHFLVIDIQNKLEVINMTTLITLENGQKAYHFTYLTIPVYLDKAITYLFTKQLNPYTNKIGLSYEYLNTLKKNDNRNYDYSSITKHYLKYLIWTEKVHVIFYLLRHFENKYNQIANLIIYSCYLIGWLFILVNILYNVFPEYFIFIPMDYDPFSDIYFTNMIQ